MIQLGTATQVMLTTFPWILSTLYTVTIPNIKVMFSGGGKTEADFLLSLLIGIASISTSDQSLYSYPIKSNSKQEPPSATSWGLSSLRIDLSTKGDCCVGEWVISSLV